MGLSIFYIDFAAIIILLCLLVRFRRGSNSNTCTIYDLFEILYSLNLITRSVFQNNLGIFKIIIFNS